MRRGKGVNEAPKKREIIFEWPLIAITDFILIENLDQIRSNITESSIHRVKFVIFISLTVCMFVCAFVYMLFDFLLNMQEFDSQDV